MGIRVPTLDVPSVSATGLPVITQRPDADAGAAAGALGDVLQRSAGMLAQLEQRERAKQNEAVQNDAYARISAWRRTAMDPVKGALARKGDQAKGLTEIYLADFDKISAEIRKGIRDERQQLDYDRMAQRERDQAHLIFARHEAEQFEAVEEGKASAALQSAKDAAATAAVASAGMPRAMVEGAQVAAAIAAPDLPDAPVAAAAPAPQQPHQLVAGDVTVTEPRDHLVETIDRRADAHGWPAEIRDRKLKEELTDLHAGVVDRLLDEEQVGAAAAYLERWKGEIDGRRLGDITKAVRHAQDVRTVGAGAEAEAMRIAGSFTSSETGWIDSDGALAQLDTLTPGPLKDEVRNRLEHRIAVAERKREKDIKTRFDGAMAAYLEGGLGAVPSATKAWLLRNAPSAWASLRERARTDLRVTRSDDLQARREQAALNAEALATFDSMPLGERVQADLHRAFPTADRPTLARLGAKQQKAKEAWDRGMDVPFAEFQARVENAAQGYSPDELKKLKARMSTWFFGWLDAHPNQLPSQADVNLELANQLELVEVSWGRDRARFLVDDAADAGRPLPAAEQTYAPARARLERASAPGGKVRVVGPGGRTGTADAATIDEWLRTHPSWRRE